MSEQPSTEELEASRTVREAAVLNIDEVIEEIIGQAEIAEASGDERTSRRLRDKLPGLRMKRDEVLSGKRA